MKFFVDWCLSLLLCVVSRGDWVGLISLPKESYRVVCPMRVILKPRNLISPVPLWGVVPWKEIYFTLKSTIWHGDLRRNINCERKQYSLQKKYICINLYYTKALQLWSKFRNKNLAKVHSTRHILIFYIWVSVHHKSIIYNKPTRCNSGSIVFINNYKYALHVSDALWVHHNEHYKL